MTASSRSDKTQLHYAVEDNDVVQASLLISQGADVNTRTIDLVKLRDAHDHLISSVTPSQLNQISLISIPYDVTVAIIYAVYLVCCNDIVEPAMTLIHVWTHAQQHFFSTVPLCASFLERMIAVNACPGNTLERLRVHVKENGVLSSANAHYASKTFGALYDWVLSVVAACSGESAVHLATSPEMIRVLSSASDLDVDLPNKDGFSKLALACRDSQSGMVEALLAIGASPVLPAQPFWAEIDIPGEYENEEAAALVTLSTRPLERVNSSRLKLCSVQCLQVLPVMLQYTLFSPKLTSPEHPCDCDPPPACVLVLSSLCFLLSVELVVPGADGLPLKMARGSEIHVLSLREAFGLIKLNPRFYEMLRVKLHHFKVNSLSSRDVEKLSAFLKKHAFCFEVLRSRDGRDESLLKYLLDDEDCEDRGGGGGGGGCGGGGGGGGGGDGGEDSCDYDADRSFGSQTRSSHRLDSLSKVLTGKGYSKRIAPAGDKKEIFQLFLRISAFVEEVVEYRIGRGYLRPLFLTTSPDICEMILKHRQFDLEEYLDKHLYCGSPALHHAVLRGNAEVVSVLLKLGACVNARSYEDGYTPMHSLMNKLSPILNKESVLDNSTSLVASTVLTNGGWVTIDDSLLLLDLGSELNASHMTEAKDYDVESSCPDESLLLTASKVLDVRVGDGGSELSTAEVGVHIVPPHVVVSHITRSSGNQRHIDINEITRKQRSASMDEDGASEGEGEEVIDDDLLGMSRILLQAGADISALDAYGYSPLAMVRHTHPKLCTLLQQSAAAALTPILLALITHLPDHAVLALVDLHSKLVAKPTQQQKLPLHLALEFGRSVAIVSSLLKHFPGGARMTMSRQRKSTAPSSSENKLFVGEIVIEQQLPFFYAVEKELSDDILTELLFHTLPVDIFANDDVSDIAGHHFDRIDSLMSQNCANHGFAWTWVLSQNCEDMKSNHIPVSTESSNFVPISITAKTQLRLVRNVVNKYIRFIEGLVYSKDRFGMHAVAIASPACRRILLSNLFFLERYELYRGEPLHESPTSLVLLARDRAQDMHALTKSYTTSHNWHNSFGGNGGERFVVLKFMKSLDAWGREVSTRKYQNAFMSDDKDNYSLDNSVKNGIISQNIANERRESEDTANRSVSGGSAGSVDKAVFFDNFNLDPANWSSGLDDEGEGFRWYFNKMTYETRWYRPHCLGKLTAAEEAETEGREFSMEYVKSIMEDGTSKSSTSGVDGVATNNKAVANEDNNVNPTKLPAQEHQITPKQQRLTRQHQINTNNVLTILHACTAANNKHYLKEHSRKGFKDFPSLIVLPLAGKSLEDILLHENPTRSRGVLTPSSLKSMDWRRIVTVTRDILQALSFLHGDGIVHCDISPQNIFRVQGKYCLIDFDKSAHVNWEDHVSMKHRVDKIRPQADDADGGEDGEADADDDHESCFTPYLAPELIHIDELTLRVIEPTRDGRPFDSLLKGNSVWPSSYAIDMWSLGVLLFRLCSNKDLFETDKNGCLVDDDLHEQLAALGAWSDDVKWKKLAVVENQLARSLLWRLLHKDPASRPTAAEALKHPFILSLSEQSRATVEARERKGGGAAGHDHDAGAGPDTVMTMPLKVKQYDIFLSCGCDVDAIHAKRLHSLLIAKNLKVFWHSSKHCNPVVDAVSSAVGASDDDGDGYCNKISDCVAFVPLLSFRVLDCFSYDALHVGGKVTKQKSKRAVGDPAAATQMQFVPQCKEESWDNFLFGLRYAPELKELGRLEKIIPVVIGEKDETAVLTEVRKTHGPTPGSRFLQSFLSVGEEIEAKVRLHLDKLKLGSPVTQGVNQIDIIPMLLSKYSGVTLRGNIEQGYHRVVESLCDVLTCAGRPDGRPASDAQKISLAGSGSAGVRGTIGALEERLRDQEAAIAALEAQMQQQAAEMREKEDELSALRAIKHEEFKEFNRMKEALTQARLKILDLKLSGGKKKQGNDDNPDESASDQSDFDSTHDSQNDNDDMDAIGEENYCLGDGQGGGQEGAADQGHDGVVLDREEDASAVISNWLSGLRDASGSELD